MKPKGAFIILLLLLHFSLTNAQNQQVIDSLQNELKTANDTTEINLLNKIAQNYIYSASDSTFKYVSMAQKKAESMGYENGLAKTYRILGTYYYNRSNLYLSKKNYQKALHLYEKLELKNSIASIFLSLAAISMIENNFLEAFDLLNKAKNIGNEETINSCNYSIAIMYAKIENYEKALQYILLSLKYFENQKDSFNIAQSHNVIGYIYSCREEDSLALFHYTYALNLTKNNNQKDYAVLLSNIGVINKTQGNFEEAKKKYLKAEEIYIQLNDLYNLAKTYINLGNLYFELSDFSESEKLYYKAHELHKTLNDTISFAIDYRNLAEIYKKQNDINKAIEFFNKSIQIAKKNNVTIVLREDYYSLFEIYQEQNNYKSTFEYFFKYTEIKDSIFTLDKEKSINNMRISYETEKNKQTIDFLKIENQLKTNTIKQYKRTEILLIIILIIIIVFSIVLFYVYLQKNKAHRRLVLKDKEVILAEKKLGISIKNEEKLIESHKKSNPNNVKLAEQILELIEKEQIYTKNNLTIHELADMLKTNQKYVSQTINVVFNKNFSNFINEYRVKKACSLFASTDSHKYTIFAIAQKVGFKSHSSFISAFKKNTGVTPIFYIKNVLE